MATNEFNVANTSLQKIHPSTCRYSVLYIIGQGGQRLTDEKLQAVNNY